MEQASAERLDDTDLAIEAENSPAPSGTAFGVPAKEVPADRTPEVSTTVMLRAISQLLVENGILDRTELVERIEQLTAESGER